MAKREISTKATTEVSVDGRAAEDQIKELTALAAKYRREMVEAQKANDLIGYQRAKESAEKAEKSVRNLAKGVKDVDSIMKNLSGATMKELQYAQKKLTAELNGMTRGTAEYIAKSKQLNEVSAEVKKVKSELYGVSGAQSNMFSKVGANFQKFMGYGLAALAYFKSFEVVLNSAQATGDKFTEVLTGVKWGLDSVMKSVSTIDFKNFFGNISESIKNGREFAKILDDLGDRERNYKLIQADARIEIEKLERIRDNVTLSNYERLRAAEDINRKEEELMRQNAAIKQKHYDAAALQVRNSTGASGKQAEDFAKNYIANEKIREQAERVIKLQDAISFHSAKAWKVLDWYGGGIAGLVRKSSTSFKDLAKYTEELTNTSPEILEYAKILRQMGKTTDNELDKMTEAYTDLSGAEFEFLQNTQKNQRKYNDLLKTINDETLKISEERKKEMLQALQDEFDQAALLTKQNYAQGTVNKREYDIQMSTLELASLEAELAMRKKFGEKVLPLEMRIADMKIKLQEQFKTEQDRISDEIMTRMEKDGEEALAREFQLSEAEFKIWREKNKKKKEMDEKALKEQEELTKRYMLVMNDFASNIGVILGEGLTDKTEEGMKKMRKALLLAAINALEEVVKVYLAEAYISMIAKYGPVKGALLGLLSTLAIKTIFAGVKNRVEQAQFGRYDVVGAEDGRTYKQVPYRGQMRTGMYTRPTLVAERGDELVVDNRTLRNVRVNFPDVIPKIQAARVAQRAEGNVGALTTAAAQQPNSINELTVATLSEMGVTLKQLNAEIARGISAEISYTHLKNKTDKATGIENKSKRGRKS